MSEPRFKYGDKAELQTGAGWTPIHIESHALRWAAYPERNGYVYLVQHSDLGRGQMPFLVHEDFLQKPEQWEPCPGEHRFADHPEPSCLNANMERRVS